MSAHPPMYFKNRLYYVLLAAGGLVALAGMYAVHLMEDHGHVITGMNNQIVWGVPHVFAIFMIVAASGVLNVASIGSVFGKALYKARAPLASLLSIAMLAGGLTVLMLDLGRPGSRHRRSDQYQPDLGIRLERGAVFRHVRAGRRLSVDDDGTAHEPV